jgi:hypothetical protein
MSPDLQECQVYVDHLTAEHRRLEHLLTQCAVAADTAAPPQGGFGMLLLQLRDELAAHFRQEEGGGCLEEAALRCPSLVPRIQAIEADHPHLLAAIDDLLESAGNPSATDRAARIAALVQRLRAHERAECDIVRQGLGGAICGDS